MTIIARPPRARRLSLVAALLGATALPNFAWADDTAPLPDVVVTADRIPEPIADTGSSITVIPGSRIAQYGTQGVTETLREVAGVEVAQSGGPGSVTTVRIRGADPGAVLVLVDGQRVGNVSATDGSLDFGNLTAANIDHIEVLRGPQTALYGSDAMAGVINIITRKGTTGETKRSVSIEGGSYGTISGRASISGGQDGWTYSLGVNAMYTDGFPQYGYRIDRPLTFGFAGRPAAPALGRPRHQGRRQRNFLLQAVGRRQRRFRLFGLRQRDSLRQSLRLPRVRRVLAGKSFGRLDRLGISAIQFRGLRRRAEQPPDLVRKHHPEPGLRDGGLLQRPLHAVHLHDDLSWPALGRGISGRTVAEPLRDAGLRPAQRAGRSEQFAKSRPERRLIRTGRRPPDHQFGLCRISSDDPAPARSDLRRARRFDRGRLDFRHRPRDPRLSHRRDRNQAARDLRQRRQGPDALSTLQPVWRSEI